MSPKFFSFFHIFLSSMLLGCLATIQPDGLTMELIHKDSPHSPLYRPNPPPGEQIPEEAVCPFARSHKQTSMISANNKAAAKNKMAIRPLTSYARQFLFLAQVGIGTFQLNSNHTSNFMTYYFQIDTANELSWIQCEGCNQTAGHFCYPHRYPPYPFSQSKSYKPISCDQHFCEPNQCKQDFCGYNVSYGYTTYGPGSYSTGVLANETFTFYSSNGKYAALKNITFGCSTDNRNMKWRFLLNTNPVGGVLGLGRGPRSFLAQLGSTSDGKFSYCIANNTQNTYLRFGKDIVESRNLHATKIMQVESSAAYYLNLHGISVNGVKLNISKADLVVKKDGSGGCIIDSGTLATRLYKPVFETVYSALLDQLSANKNLKRWYIHKFHKDLCYEVLSGDISLVKNFPVVLTFHLENADLQIQPEHLFLYRWFYGANVYCLSLIADDSITAIGAHQQMNQKFVYDTKAQVLSFGPEDCEKNG